ncbi:MAG: hypothetical protein IT370_26745 [Deltaproteobacteria bacterium]|nr:hypothetical protein [Deltaproteobacteria bacterium]
MKAEFEEQCEKIHAGLDGTLKCELLKQDKFPPPTFPADARYLGVSSEETCHAEAGKFLSSGRPFNSIVTIEAPSVVRFASPDLAGDVHLEGHLAFSGGNCRSGQCPIELHWVDAHGDDVSLVRPSRKTLKRPAVINVGAASGTCFGGPEVCFFRFPTGSLGALLTGTWTDNERRLATVTNDRPAGGIINFRTREVLVSGLFQSSGTQIHLNLRGHLDNLAPRVALPLPSPIPCVESAPCTVQSMAEDADGLPGGIRYSWFIDGRSVSSLSPSLETRLTRGSHSVRLLVIDSDNGMAAAGTTVDVVTPPPLRKTTDRDGRGPGIWGLAALGLSIAALALFLVIRRRRRK